jgi:hypothetical protein
MSEPHERLSEAMNARRLALRMNWRTVATAAGVSPEALRAIRRGDYRPAELTARRIDEALQWEPGSVERILCGGEPAASDLTLTTPAAAEAKAPAADAEDIDLDTYVPTSPAEEALLAIYRANQQAVRQQLAALGAQESDDAEHERHRKGA